MLSMMTAEQIAEWEAYDRLEPIGGFRQDYRFAQLCCLIVDIAQAMAGKKGRRKKTSPFDFMPWGPKPDKGKAQKARTPEEIKQLFSSIIRCKGKKLSHDTKKPPRIQGGLIVK